MGKGTYRYNVRGGGSYTHGPFSGPPARFNGQLVFDEKGSIFIDNAVQSVACEWKLSPV